MSVVRNWPWSIRTVAREIMWRRELVNGLGEQEEQWERVDSAWL